MNKREKSSGCKRHKTRLYSEQNDILWNICGAGRDLVRLALTVIWAKVRMRERLRHLVLCAAPQPIWKACGQITPKSASERVCVLACFYLCLCACVCVCLCACVFKKRGELQVDCAHLAVRRFFSTVLTRGCCPNRRLLSACLCVCVCVCPKSKEAIITDSNSRVVFIRITTTLISGYISPLFHTKCYPTSAFTL